MNRTKSYFTLVLAALCVVLYQKEGLKKELSTYRERFEEMECTPLEFNGDHDIIYVNPWGMHVYSEKGIDIQFHNWRELQDFVGWNTAFQVSDEYESTRETWEEHNRAYFDRYSKYMK